MTRGGLVGRHEHLAPIVIALGIANETRNSRLDAAVKRPASLASALLALVAEGRTETRARFCRLIVACQVRPFSLGHGAGSHRPVHGHTPRSCKLSCIRTSSSTLTVSEKVARNHAMAFATPCRLDSTTPIWATRVPRNLRSSRIRISSIISGARSCASPSCASSSNNRVAALTIRRSAGGRV